MLEPHVASALAQGEQRIVVTGAGGWLGLATLELLADALGQDFAKRVACFGSSARTLELRGGRHVPQAPLADLKDLPARPTWLLHLAFLTKDRAEAMSEADYRAANRAIGDTVLGALDRIGVEAIFVASSGAAGRADDPAASAAMRLYGALKQADEALFASWAEAKDRRAVIARIFSLTGPYINKHQAYAMASFILDGIAGRPIAVNAPHGVSRSYVAIRELMSLAFASLGAGKQGVVRFDSGGKALELGDVARTVASVFEDIEVQRAPIGDTPEDRYCGDDDAYTVLLARHSIAPVSLAQQVAETAAYLRGDAA